MAKFINSLWRVFKFHFGPYIIILSSILLLGDKTGEGPLRMVNIVVFIVEWKSQEQIRLNNCICEKWNELIPECSST